MNTSRNHALESSVERIGEKTYARFFRETLPIYRREGLSGVMDELLKRAGVYVKCIQEQNPAFLLMRNRLNTQGGLIISNHPGYFDIPVVLQAIKRKDIKAMVTEKRFEQLAALYGDHFIPARHDARSAKKAIDEICGHIGNGGAFLLFPSGRDEVKYHDRGFQSGFRALIERLNPDAMVYAFHVSPDDIRDMIQRESANPLARLARLQLGTHPIPRFTIRLNEAYTTCGDWQENIEGVIGSRAKNQRLTGRYYELFSQGHTTPSSVKYGID